MTAEKLLDAAASLLSQNVSGSMEFAAASLRYPASYQLAAFLYKLSEVNQSLADEVYRRAFATYRDKPLREFLYLAIYPFGLDTTGDLPVTGSYVVPGTLRRNPGLQSLFAQTLMIRARRAMENGVGEQDNYSGLSGAGHIAEAITLIEPELRKRFPDLATQLIQMRSELLISLPADVQPNISHGDHPDNDSNQQSFDERLEAIEKGQDSDWRDQQLTRLVAVLAQAIKIINQLENPDFSQEFFFRRIEGRNFATYAGYKTLGTNPDSAFRDLAKIDFDSAIVQSTQINDKPLRAQITLSLADFCLTRR
jgi:hypothetical protein